MIFEAWFRFKGSDSRLMDVWGTKIPETVRAERVEIGRTADVCCRWGKYGIADWRAMEWL